MIPQSHALVPKSLLPGPYLGDFTLDLEIAILETQVKTSQTQSEELTKEYFTITSSIKSMLDWFEDNTEIGETIKSLKKYRDGIVDELEELRKAEAKRLAEEEIAREKERRLFERKVEAQHEPVRLKTGGDKPEDHKAEATRLYRKISSKCHPDKTKSERLHEIFRLAAIAYRNLDVATLRELYDSYLNRFKIRRKRKDELLAKVKYYKELFQRTQVELGKILSDPAVDLLTQFNNETLLSSNSSHLLTKVVFSRDYAPAVIQAIMTSTEKLLYELETAKRPQPAYVVFHTPYNNTTGYTSSSTSSFRWF